MYKYITENNLLDRQKYNYSEYCGKPFLDEYLATREQFVASLPGDATPCEIAADSPSGERIRRAVATDDRKEIDRFVKSFEVRKRLYREYDEKMKPLDEDDYRSYDIYLSFSMALGHFYRATGSLTYLNCWLKLNDTLLSIASCLSDGQRACLGEALKDEVACFREISQGIATDFASEEAAS